MNPRLGREPRDGTGKKSLPYRSAACNMDAATQHWTNRHFHDNAMTTVRRRVNSADVGRRSVAATGGKEP
jgi:hypothetical protein